MNKFKVFSEYNPEYAKKLIKRKEKSIRRYFSKGESIEGIENLRQTRDKQTIYVSNHKSPLDGLFQGKLIFENREPDDFAHIIVATDLNLVLFRMFGYDLSKLNFCWIDRKRRSEENYYKEWSKQVENALRKKESFLVYPEGTRGQDSDVAIGKLKNGFLREVIDSGEDPLITPMAIDYDHVYDEPFYFIQNWGKRNFMPLYYAGFILPVLIHPFSKRRNGAVYINAGEPKRLSEIIGNERNRLGSLKKFLEEQITEEYQKIKERTINNNGEYPK